MNHDKETVTLDLSEDTLFKLMLMAHEQDITLNQFINNILKEELAKAEPFACLNNDEGCGSDECCGGSCNSGYTNTIDSQS